LINVINSVYFNFDEIKLCKENFYSLVNQVLNINDNNVKAYLLSITTNFDLVEPDSTSFMQLQNQAIDIWEKGDDLYEKVLWGHHLSRVTSKKNKKIATKIYKRIKEIESKNNIKLNSYELIDLYIDLLNLSIRSLNKFDLMNCKIFDQLTHYIERVFWQKDKIYLFGKLSACAYRVELPMYAEKLLKNKILNRINLIQDSHYKKNIVQHIFPVIFEYNQKSALKLISNFSNIRKNKILYYSIIWLTCKCHLGDEYLIDIDDVQIVNDYKRIKNVLLSVLDNLNVDFIVYYAINVVSNSIKASASFIS